jgi:hypothetical protein
MPEGPPPVGCFYCGGVPSLVRDHFVPKSFGGSDGARNRVDACWDCDRRKGSLHPRDWLRLCPPAGQQRVLAKLRKLGISLDDTDLPRGRPGRVKATPPRDGRSSSDGPGSRHGRLSQDEARFQQESIERLIAQPMPPPDWTVIPWQPPAGPVRSLREHARRYLELRDRTSVR